MKKVLLLAAFLLPLLSAMGQTRTISGKIRDDKGIPLSNVSVLVKGTSVGTTSNLDGDFSITLPAGARTLVLSRINMTSTEVEIGEQSVINATMQASDKVLDEVVVTGVGTGVSKRKVAISVESISAKDLPKVPQGSIDQALVGKIPGAQITSISGQPGQQAAIVLRGINTLSTTQPMILVDGMQINTTSNRNGTLTSDDNQGRGNLVFQPTNPPGYLILTLANIERVEVIQGAAAATIYGAQGANGVIQIFTKKGVTQR